MKYLFFIGLFLGGGILGYFIGTGGVDQSSNLDLTKKEYITEIVYDTIIEKERVEIPVYLEREDTILSNDLLKKDSVFIDTLTERIKQRDTIIDDGSVIRTEKKIAERILPIQFLSKETLKDTIIKDLLGIKETKRVDVMIEFWESPLGFSGYKLSRNKLIAYGLSPQFDYELYKKAEIYYLSYQEILYKLIETQDFLSFEQVDKKEVLND